MIYTLIAQYHYIGTLLLNNNHLIFIAILILDSFKTDTWELSHQFDVKVVVLNNCQKINNIIYLCSTKKMQSATGTQDS